MLFVEQRGCDSATGGGGLRGIFWVGRHQKSGRVGCYAPTLNLSGFVNMRAMVGSAHTTMDGGSGLKKGGVFRLFCIYGYL